MIVTQEILVANSAGVLALVVCMMTRHQIKKEWHFNDRAFNAMIWMTMLALIAEAVSFVIDGQPGKLVNVLQYILNAYTFVASSGVGFLWVIFVDARIFRSTKRLKKWFCTLIVPFLLIIVLLFCDIFMHTGFIFSISADNVYERGNLVLISYIFLFATYLFSIIIAVLSIYRDCYASFFPVHLFVLPCLVGTIVQGLFYGISVGWFCVALSLLFIQLHLANQNAYEDDLSGLYNRKYFNWVITKLSKSTKKRKVYGVYMDIDFFKEINDKFGHAVGDDAIAQIGLLLSNISTRDRIAFRYGGDEFIVLDIDGTKASVENLMSDIRKEFETFNATTDKPYQLFVSMGYAEYTVGDTEAETFLNQLDKKMYEQKALKNGPMNVSLDSIDDMDEVDAKRKLFNSIQQNNSVKDFLKRYLDKPKDENTLNLLLKDVGEYYRADRAYIFEIDQDKQTMNNTYEWCNDGVTPEIGMLQEIPASLVQKWIEAFEEKGEFYISSLSEEYQPGNPTYDILKVQDIESLIAAPIYIEDTIKGFLAVDNPTIHIDDLLLLSVVAATSFSEIVSMEIYASAQEDFDTQLGLKNHVIGAMSEVYSCIYYFDIDSEEFTEIHSVDIVRDKIGTGGKAGDKLNYFAKNMVASEHVDMMTEFVDLSTLRERLSEYRIISAQYRSLNWMGYEDTDGMWHECSFRIGDYDENGNIAHAIFTARPIHGLKMQEVAQTDALREAFAAADTANKAKSNFLSSMSHDLRTPMNGIIGMTAIAIANIDDKERVNDCLQKITGASKQLLSLINEVLDMSKIESGKVNLAEEEFNLSDLVENLLVVNEPFIKEHKHKLITSVSHIEHEDVIGDSLQIQKVFNNLLSNAVKYTPSGGEIRITISEEPSDSSKVGCYEFIFEDNGIGMSPEFIETIFEPFARSSQSMVRSTQGTGLGMPISRNIIRKMGGDIKIESTEGVGSKITVTMYLKLQDKTAIDCSQFEGLSVLVADDDKLSLESCCKIIEKLGMKSDGVLSGAEAVEKAVQHHKDKQDYFACIFDWRMPDMDGVTAVKKLHRSLSPDTHIIIISAYDWSEIEREARTVGVEHFISKPLFPSRLARTFREILGHGDEDEGDDKLNHFDELDLTGRRVLLVEDNMLNAEIATEILEMTGLIVEKARDGLEAVDFMSECEDGYYDIVFMDIQMPRMNGYDATRAIRNMKSNYCKSVPIIAMTANAFADDIQSAQTAGMDGHIAKPLDLNVLAKVLTKWLEN